MHWQAQVSGSSSPMEPLLTFKVPANFSQTMNLVKVALSGHLIGAGGSHMRQKPAGSAYAPFAAGVDGSRSGVLRMPLPHLQTGSMHVHAHAHACTRANTHARCDSAALKASLLAAQVWAAGTARARCACATTTARPRLACCAKSVCLSGPALWTPSPRSTGSMMSASFQVSEGKCTWVRLHMMRALVYAHGKL